MNIHQFDPSCALRAGVIAALIALILVLAFGPLVLSQSIALDAPMVIEPGDVFGLSAAATGDGTWAVTLRIGDDLYDWITPRGIAVPIDLATAAGVLPADWWGDMPVYVTGSAYTDESMTPVTTAQVEILLSGPSPTPAPPTPTAAPDLPCRRGHAVVRSRDIPLMHDGNKDDLNKTLLFCLRDEQDSNFVGVYHRYLQPAYPNGPWWPTWRVEAGADGCVEEWNIWESMDLPGDEATFRIEWSEHSVTVTHEGTEDSQTLHLRNTLALDYLAEDDGCSSWGWTSEATAELLESDCVSDGLPTVCPTATPAPTATPSVGAFGFVSGAAELLITGLERLPTYAQPQILFMLSSGDIDETGGRDPLSGVGLRIADNSHNGQIRGQWCLGCDWADSGYYGPTLTDGTYRVEWDVGWVTVTTPAGDVIETGVPWTHAPRYLDVGEPWGGHRLGEPAQCQVTVTSISWGTPGRMDGC